MDRSQRVRDQQPAHRRRVRGRVEASSAMEFFNVLTSPEMLELTEGHLPEHRERLYPPTVTLAMFLRQALSADVSCQQAVNTWAVSRAAEGLSPQSVSAHAPAAWRWRGRRVRSEERRVGKECRSRWSRYP